MIVLDYFCPDLHCELQQSRRDSFCVLHIVWWDVLAFCVLKNAAQIQDIGAALGAFETAYTAQVVRALFRLDTVFTQFVTFLAVRAFIGVESQEERRDAIEQREDRAQLTEQSAPGSSDKEDGDQEIVDFSSSFINKLVKMSKRFEIKIFLKNGEDTEGI